MMGKQLGQMDFSDMEAKGRVSDSHFLRKIGGQIEWRLFKMLLAPLYHYSQGRHSYSPLMMFKGLLL